MKNLNPLLKEMTILVLISIVLGVSAQAVLPHGISLKTEITLVENDSSSVAIAAVSINPTGDGEAATNISLQDAYHSYENNATIFFDARSPEDYADGHIQGAKNLPVHAFLDSLSYLESLDFNGQIITYCDGADCNASIDLAADLKMMGFSNVYFFFGGWQAWEEAGYPIESGS